VNAEVGSETGRARENAARAPGERPRDLPGYICPRCGERYTNLEVRRVDGRDYLYAVHDNRVNGKRVQHRCYLGPKDGYRYGAAARIETPWFGAPLFSANTQEKFRTYLGYLENLVWATISVTTTTEDIGEVLQTLGEAQRAATRRLLLQTAAPAGQRATGAAGGDQ
jgi:hypothetical protein